MKEGDGLSQKGWPVPKLGLVSLPLTRQKDPKATVCGRATPPGLT